MSSPNRILPEKKTVSFSYLGSFTNESVSNEMKVKFHVKSVWLILEHKIERKNIVLLIAFHGFHTNVHY